MPSIVGPAAAARNGPPPTFQVDPGPGSYYAVEITTHPQLFAWEEDAVPPRDQFFSSWSAERLSDASTFTMPADAWDRLSYADSLYYRIWTSTSATVWSRAETTTPNDSVDQAPAIQVVSLSTGGKLPVPQAPVSAIWERARQHAAIRPLLDGEELQVSIILHLFSPRRPIDPRAVEWVVIASRQGAGDQVETGLVRVDRDAQALQGAWSGRDALDPTDADEAWARMEEPSWAAGPGQLERVGDVWVLSVLSPPPTARGGTMIVGARTDRLIYKAMTEWGGGGQVLVPT